MADLTQCRISAVAATAMCDVLVDLIDGGDAAGKLVLYIDDGTPDIPAYADTALTDATEAATITLNDPAFGAAAADAGNHWAEADLDVDPDLADASATGGVVKFFRFTTSAGTVVIQGSAGVNGADTYDVNMNSATIGAGANVSATSFQVRVPYNQA